MENLSHFTIFVIISIFLYFFMHPITFIPNIIIFITEIFIFNNFIEFSYINNINNNTYMILSMLFLISMLLFIHRILKYIIRLNFMQIFILVLFIFGFWAWLWAKIPVIGEILLLCVVFLIIQWFIFSIINKKKENWYFKILLFPNIYYIVMNLFISDKYLKQLQEEQNYNEIHKISKEKIDFFINNLKKGYYITDTNLIVFKKIYKNTNFKILYDRPYFNGEKKFKKIIKRIYGKTENNKYAEVNPPAT